MTKETKKVLIVAQKRKAEVIVNGVNLLSKTNKNVVNTVFVSMVLRNRIEKTGTKFDLS